MNDLTTAVEPLVARARVDAHGKVIAPSGWRGNAQDACRWLPGQGYYISKVRTRDPGRAYRWEVWGSPHLNARLLHSGTTVSPGDARLEADLMLLREHLPDLPDHLDQLLTGMALPGGGRVEPWEGGERAGWENSGWDIAYTWQEGEEGYRWEVWSPPHEDRAITSGKTPTLAEAQLEADLSILIRYGGREAQYVYDPDRE